MKIYHNQYKREDIFTCSHYTHKNFNKKVSVYHVLIDKKCYPSGCVEFIESCKLKSSCPKGYKKINYKCENCKFYHEEKIVNIPKPVDQNTYNDFQEELNEFSEWIQNKIARKIQFWGIINSVKPHLEKIIYPGQEIIIQKGYIVSFKEGYIDKDFLEDYSYLFLNEREFNNIQPMQEDEVEFKAKLYLNKGRIILRYPSNYQILNRKGRKKIDEFDMKAAKTAGKTVDIQLDKCFNCDKGILIDVSDKKINKNYRRIFCMKGISDPKECYYYALVQNDNESIKDSEAQKNNSF